MVRIDDRLESEISAIAEQLNLSNQEIGSKALRLYVLLHKQVNLSQLRDKMTPSFCCPKDELLSYLLSNAVETTDEKSGIYVRLPKILKVEWARKMKELNLSESDGLAHVIQYFAKALAQQDNQMVRNQIAEAWKSSKARQNPVEEVGILHENLTELKEQFDDMKRYIVGYYLANNSSNSPINCGSRIENSA